MLNTKALFISSIFHKGFYLYSANLLLVIVSTWNVNSLRTRMPRVEEWLLEVSPDIVCLQETKMADDIFPSLHFKTLGYDSVHHGEGRWNGVAILSKVGLENPVFDFGLKEESNEARFVSADCGGIKVHCVYVPNGRTLEDDHFQYKLRWLKQLRKYLGQFSEEDNLLVAGDWNVALTDKDVWDPNFFEGSTHVSPQERESVNEIIDLGLVDVFRKQYPDDNKLFSYYDYQAGRFHKRQGMRIDFMLLSENLAEKSVINIIDRNARKGEKPSDHAPVLTILTD